jgi:hypothetical protein
MLRRDKTQPKSPERPAGLSRRSVSAKADGAGRFAVVVYATSSPVAQVMEVDETP